MYILYIYIIHIYTYIHTYDRTQSQVDGCTGQTVAIKSIKLMGSNGKASGYDHNANLPKAVFREITVG